MIIWIMGLNGAGKSSVSRELEKILLKKGISSIILDGNHLRELFEQNGYDRASRISLGIRYAELAKALEAPNKAIIIAANGMLKEVCAYNRAHLNEYYEVFLDVPESVLRARDSKGIYSQFETGLIRNVGGLDLEVDIPEAHLHIPYDSALSPYDIALKIEDFLCAESKKAQISLSNSQKIHSILSTKAATLAALKLKLKTAQILPLWTMSKEQFMCKKSMANLIKELELYCSNHKQVSFIIRSSAKSEDTQSSSNAGAFESLANISLAKLQDSIYQVFCSYYKHLKPQAAFEKLENDEVVLIQPMAEDIVCAGVAFNIHPKSGAPYYVVEYALASTDSITSGQERTETFYIAKSKSNASQEYLQNPHIEKILSLVVELESIIPNTPLDVEFGINKQGQVCCFQVRPLIVGTNKSYPKHSYQLELLSSKISQILKPSPRLFGQQGILGVMPDWNPAEIIGLHPRPLAFSLYSYLITDSIYAQGRAKYGYKDVSDNPLIFNLHGKPYVDVRASFNSFLPHNLDEKLSKKLVDFYLNQLRENPHWHDKVEFEILFDSYYFNTPKRLEKLKDFGFNAGEIAYLQNELNMLANMIIEQKIYEKDIRNIEILAKKREHILQSNLSRLEKIYWLLQDCKHYGTSAFVGLARIGFMAMGFLNSLVEEGVLSPAQKDNFIANLECVTSRLSIDLYQMDKASFLRKYGHLRPGTYDILSPRYDENFAFYFRDKKPDSNTESTKNEDFLLSLSQMKSIDSLLKDHNINCDVLSFFDFIATGIMHRESSKFEFSKNLSEALRLIGEMGAEYGLSNEEMSYCDVGVFFKAYGTSNNPERLVLESIENNKASYELQQGIVLPPLICSPNDVFAFAKMASLPNFITQKRVSAPVISLELANNELHLEGKIVCIERADPGFDWIFSHSIAGLVTAFGGANSHMAIRANELQIPAVIGCGEKFSIFSQAKALEIDCANAKVVVL